MDSVKRGWQLGGYVGSRLAVVYALLAALFFYLQVGADGGLAAVWQPDKLVVAQLLGNGFLAVVLTPLLAIVPIGMAWLAGSIAGWLTGLLAWLFTNKTMARWWGMFCFSIPPLVFHTAANLRPNLVLGDHWLNSYWFWVGLPSLIAVLVGGWVGERLAGRERIVEVTS
jgi:hypothetical protein